MKRMVTDEQIIELIKKYAPGFDPSTIEAGDIPQDAVLGIEDGEIVKGNLFGKYVRIMNAPASTTLTEDQVKIFKEGVFVQGWFLGLLNPIFFPCVTVAAGSTIRGLLIGTDGTNEKISEYAINASNKISIVIDLFSTFPAANYIAIGRPVNMAISKLSNKAFPAYPNAAQQSGKRYHFILDDGALTWHEGNGLYLHSIVFDVGQGNTFTIRLISDSATTCALDAGTGNFTIPDSTFIQPANMGNVVIVPLDANKFAPDIYAFDSATGAFTDNITLASVTSDTVTPIG